MTLMNLQVIIKQLSRCVIMSYKYYFWLALIFLVQKDQQEVYLLYKPQTVFVGKYNFSFLLFMKWAGKKFSRLRRQHFWFISYFSCAFKNIFVTTLKYVLRVEGIKRFFYFHDFWLFFWDSSHKKLNNHYKVWSYKKAMKKRMFKKRPKMCLLTVDIKPFRQYIKGKRFAEKEFQRVTVWGYNI